MVLFRINSNCENIYLLIIVLLSSRVAAYAQNGVIKGTRVSIDGKPAGYVNIILKEVKKGYNGQ